MGLNVERNKYFKNKKCVKLSVLTDINGIPLSTIIKSGNVSDVNFVYTHIKAPWKIRQSLIFQGALKEFNNNKQYKKINVPLLLLADKGYDSNNIRLFLYNNNIDSIISYNKRNTKDPTKIKHLTREQKKIYSKRIKIENFF